ELPKYWTDVHSMTISYGHGISTTPLQFATAVAALVNGGFAIHPTFLKIPKEGREKSRKRLLSADTSDRIRYLMRRNVIAGTGKSAAVPGYRVGGKTGSAEKVIGGKYDTNALLTSFVGIFPADKPAYLTFIMLDEPQAEAHKKSRPTAGQNATIVTARLINRIGPMLGVVPAKEFTTSFDEILRSPY
ncbi:MAG: penicillin-binding transpeptidase domain-containing protein, partial [Methyloligellaceae bacterium]